jgi:hypothetical protein
MMVMPGYTAETSAYRRHGHYHGVGSAFGGSDKHSAVTPAVHCHLETHTPDPSQGYGSCPAHEWLGYDCVYIYCD